MIPLALVILSSSLPIPFAEEHSPEERGEELLHVYERIQELHPDPFFGTPQEDFELALDELYGRIPDLSDNEFIVELMRFVALLSREGRDGHSGLVGGHAFTYLPLQLYRFEDGWFVVNARDEALLGARLQRVGQVGVEEACTRIAPLLTKDNDTGLLPKLAASLVIPELLSAVGLAEDGLPVELGFTTTGGRHLARSLEGLSLGDYRAWSGVPAAGLPPISGALWLSRTRSTWWMRVLEEERALYVQYNAVAARNDDGASIAELGATIVRTFEEQDLERVVLDLRLNGGGNNGTFPPLISALQRSERLNRRGRLYALVGRHTFSAAGNFVTVFQRDLNSILVGEPTGGAPNQFGDARTVPLLHHHGVLLRLSTRYHEFGSAGDLRLTHEPDLAVGMPAAAYFAGDDPVLRAALDHPLDAEARPSR